MKANLLPASEIGKRIKQFRQYKGLTATAFAASIGVSKQTIFNLEKGRHRPRYEVIAGTVLRYSDFNPMYFFQAHAEMTFRMIDSSDSIQQIHGEAQIELTNYESSPDKLTICVRENDLLRKMIKDKEELIELLRKQ